MFPNEKDCLRTKIYFHQKWYSANCVRIRVKQECVFAYETSKINISSNFTVLVLLISYLIPYEY